MSVTCVSCAHTRLVVLHVIVHYRLVCAIIGWLRGTVVLVERRSLTGELLLSCARPAANG